MSHTVLIAGIFHETHSFVDDTTPLEDFQIRLGDELLDCTGDASPLGGALEYADSQGWQMIPTIGRSPYNMWRGLLLVLTFVPSFSNIL